MERDENIGGNAGTFNDTAPDASSFWLVGHTFGSKGSQLTRFLEQGIWEGQFGDGEQDQKQANLASSVKSGDVLIVKATSTCGPGHQTPFLRVKRIGIAESDMEVTRTDRATKCMCRVRYVSTKDDDEDFYGAASSYRQTIHKAGDKAKEIIEYARKRLQRGMSYQQYIDLLCESHNLVLTGAPGTGKTFMARQMAREMGCTEKEVCFAQFHPSYDYTDFVEGLRPVENSDGQIGFERKDGIFKAFCKRALKNLTDSQKSTESLSKERSWEERMRIFLEAAMDAGTEFALSSRNTFVISELKEGTIIAYNEQNSITKKIKIDADAIIELLTQELTLRNVKDVREHFGRRNNTQADSYVFALVNAIRNKKSNVVERAEKVDRRPFVFIIDEINRGEASKIFGELFFAIDPGYRGDDKTRVQTQYQNLVPESDAFASGFFVPENVYIIATMNDIDRSVESMDFAMRRRFAWREVTPTDTETMLDGLECAESAKATMRRINETIAATDGLGPAYQIGPAYFLKLSNNGNDFNRLWQMNIEPLLKEYLRGFRKGNEVLETLRDSFFATKEESTSSELSDEN